MATKKKYIAVGVQADFEILFNKFAKCKPLNFVEFAKVWRKMKMSMICMGRQTENEAKLLIEECLWITLNYFRAPYNFEVKTGAFFLLYGLYSTQFFVPKVRIRCTLNNWEELNCFIKDAMSKKMTDVEFIFHRLCVMKAFIYVASPNNVSIHTTLISSLYIYLHMHVPLSVGLSSISLHLYFSVFVCL
ncbi:snRNA-activating protein complex subunit 1 [Octopus bimaculoides]|nr:snRNA-activating protein complex subunit 1 [Octopus bimaculoides]XP_052833185.1 snRNA-activating protein complex subunit 1 [Octopus bimaculoides]XP_052833186.1 snRNA-activating protein complex subunit 1 [Octopus bimaculoides]XP_052833187.1 snRNA-activating protein complex subunit 1 [Octopus bimaculoides]XP_052833188.1 snRNA-activating protein complex subunit 1 [Octopus bimaculoides]XP_052833189.1 snRNA-activating protein complex subunit 1 [Octopus bimaculoides]XP_052833190.1 snRNA-activati